MKRVNENDPQHPFEVIRLYPIVGDTDTEVLLKLAHYTL